MKAKIVVIAIALVAMTGVVTAQNNNSKGTGVHYIDANKDGQCDNKGSKVGKGERKGPKEKKKKKRGQGKGKGNRQGKADGSGAGNGNFVDTNNNGICDNKE